MRGGTKILRTRYQTMSDFLKFLGYNINYLWFIGYCAINLVN